jgi:hypothetical protein
MNRDKVTFYKWPIKENKEFFDSVKDNLELTQPQIYTPHFSLYFDIHNTKKSHKLIDLNRRYYLQKFVSVSDVNDFCSNNFAEAKVYDSHLKCLLSKEAFCKCVPLLDPLHYTMNNYNIGVHRNPLLPSGYNHNTFYKINDIHNTAYIDLFFSFICSKLTESNTLPSFPLYYGSVNGIKQYFKYDITEDYSHYKHKPWFTKYIGKLFTINFNIYTSDSDNESDNVSEISMESLQDEDTCNESEKPILNSDDSLSELSFQSDDSEQFYDDCIALIKNIPCQYFFIEKLEGTLDKLIKDNINSQLIKTCMFQVSFALCFLQKKYKFCHNDLHINNIMFQKTEKTYLYYKFNNMYFKVPTHGYIFKIIDFGRSIFEFHNKLFMNDNFDKFGEADGQFVFDNGKPNVNYHFDLCRLAMTILDEIDYDKDKEYEKHQPVINFLYNLTIYEDDKSFIDLQDDFQLYIDITKKACNSLPNKVIQNYLFEDYKISKKKFPKKLYYSLN